jgi:exonuclease SbcD
MRILHTSDWHLGKTLENVSRLEEQRDFVDTLCRLAEDERIDLVLVAGDIFDTYNPSAAAEELFYEAMNRLNAGGKRAVVVIAGNHDNPERLCAASTLAYKDGIILLGYPASDAGAYSIENESIRLLDSGPGWLELQLPNCAYPAVILTMPYPSEARLEQLLSEEAKEGTLSKAYSDKIESIFHTLSGKFREDTVNLVIAHLFLAGGKESESERTIQVGTAMTVSPSAIPSNAHFAALGHLHRPQQIKAAPCPAYYSGSPLAYSFSEADYGKAIYVIDAQPGASPDIKEVYLNCGKPLRRWSAKEGIGQALQWCEEGRDRNAWVDLEIYTDRILTAEEQKQMRELHPGILNIRPVLRTEAGESLEPESREGRKIDELFREYYRYRLGVDINDELMAAFLEVLNDSEESEDIELGMQEAAAGTDDGGEDYEA